MDLALEMMGGNINVESEKGKGSTFSFSVKLKKPTSQPAIETTGAASRESYSFNFGSADDDMEEEESEIYKLGSDENRKQIKENMEKLVICIEMENWDRANSFAENVKQLVQEDAMNLKRKAFRLQMTVRKGDHDSSISQYEELKAAIDEKFSGAVEE